MQEAIEFIKGGNVTDERGIVYYINDFDMSEIRRMYRITHPSTEVRRGWRGHKLEQRWFHAVEGNFEVNVVQIDDFQNPNIKLPIRRFTISADKTEILHVPRGYATLLRARVEYSSCVIYADTLIEYAENDNYLYPVDYFVNYQ